MKMYLSRKFFVSTLAIATFYLLFTIYLMNYRLVMNTVLGFYPFIYKFKVLASLLEGMWTTMTKRELLVLVVTSFLTGANLTLLTQKLRELRRFEGLHLTTGGGSVLAIVGSGCPTCGLPVMALLGLSGSVAYLPFAGTELSYIGILLLTISLYSLIKNRRHEHFCHN